MVSTTHHATWPLGSLVVERGDELTRHSIRVVVGYRADGRCLTQIAMPPPWMQARVAEAVRPSHLRRIDETPVSLQGFTRSDCSQCPIRFACDGQGATASRHCFMDEVAGGPSKQVETRRPRRSLSERLRRRILGLASPTPSGMGAVS